MITLVIVVLAVLVVGAIVWARVVSARSATKSVETYERALGVLGEVSRRTESTGFRILPHEEAGRPHVGRRIDEAGGEVPTARRDLRTPGEGQLSSSRLPPAGEPKLRFSAPNRPPGRAPEEDQRTGDQERAEQEAGALRRRAGAAGWCRRPCACHTRPRTGARHGRGSCSWAGIQVTSRSPSSGDGATGHDRYGSGFGGGGNRCRRDLLEQRRWASRGAPDDDGSHRRWRTYHDHHLPTTTLPTSLKPTSVSRSGVAFTVLSGSYTLAFQATGGGCWVGIEHTAAGPWLFAETLESRPVGDLRRIGRARHDARRPEPRRLHGQRTGGRAPAAGSLSPTTSSSRLPRAEARPTHLAKRQPAVIAAGRRVGPELLLCA